jgi:ABC-type phosphate transport system ATPase subunit
MNGAQVVQPDERQSLRQAALWDEVKNRLGRSGLSLSGGQAQQATRVSDRTAFCSVLVNPDSDTRTGVLVEYGSTQKIFGDPDDPRTQAYVTGRAG